MHNREDMNICHIHVCHVYTYTYIKMAHKDNAGSDKLNRKDIKRYFLLYHVTSCYIKTETREYELYRNKEIRNVFFDLRVTKIYFELRFSLN